MRLHNLIFFSIYTFFTLILSADQDQNQKSFGLWVPCQSENATLSSIKKIDEMLMLAHEINITDLYVQIYRENKSWFNSSIVDDTPFEDFYKKEKRDLFQYIIQEAHKKNMKVHAWMNIFRVGKNPQATILRKYGTDIITRDNLNRSMKDYPEFKLPLPHSKYFIYGEDGCWLDPGDLRVHQYYLELIQELLNKYPGIDGVHFDFFRYPYTVPFGPGSKWNKGIEFGYGIESVKRFKSKYQLDPFTMEKNEENCQLWDNWRRDQITDVLKKSKNIISKMNSKVQLSAAALCWSERAYQSSFQDWRRWLEEGLVHHVAVMNYTQDYRFFRYLAQSAVSARSNSKVRMGIGLYLLEKKPDLALKEIQYVKTLAADGVILFAFEALKNNPLWIEQFKKL